MEKEDPTEKLRDCPTLSRMEELKKSDLLSMLNATYIARRFFGKTSSWFSQQLNNNIVNGKPAEFSPEELETLHNALHTMSVEIQEIADGLR